MKIHFIGIGGIGVSALAQYYLAKGHEVTGSDLTSSEITELVENKGAKLLKNVPRDVDLVIYSPAVQPDNPKFKQAKKQALSAGKQGVKLLSYPEALGQLTKEYFTIAVSGTHGKSTTSSMIALILIKAALDPTVIVGTKLEEFGNSNFRAGKSKYLLIEADEWNFSFLNYWPQMIILTNIEVEHLDTYRDLNHILKTYQKYVSRLPKNGLLILNSDDDNILKLKTQNAKQQNYTSKQEEVKKLKEVLQVPGEHNIYNALAALTTARALGVSDEISFQALSSYQGVWRRFDLKEEELNNKKFTLIHDYAHHPSEVEATLKAAKEKFPNKKIWCVFQPHQYQRTFYLFDNFIKVLSESRIDKLIVTDIYDVAGREKGDIKKKINSQKLVKKINKSWIEYLAKGKVKKYLEENLENEQILIIMGAGDVYKILDTG